MAFALAAGNVSYGAMKRAVLILLLFFSAVSFAWGENMPIPWRPEYDSLLMMEDTSVVNREQAARFLKASERNPDSGLAIRTIRTLGIIGDSTAADLLLRFLDKPGYPTAQEAAFALSQMGVKSARPALEKAALSNSPELAAKAVEALARSEERRVGKECRL